MTINSVVLVPLALYLLILVVLGWWGRRGTQDLAGYYVAGKRLPSWVIAFSSNATGESGWLLLGLTGMGYLIGVHAFWVILGEVLGVTLGWVLIARPFKAFTDRYGSITVADFFESRLRDDSQWVRKVSVVIVLSMAVTYTSAQLVASGKAFSSFLGVTYATGVLIGAVVTFFYTSVGGFKAVAYSDLVQGVLMMLGLIVLPIVGIAAAGGWHATFEQLSAADPALLLPMGQFGPSWAGFLSAASMATIGLAFLGVPQLLTRFMSAKNDEELVNGSVIAVLCIVVFDVGAVLTGIAGRVLFPGLGDQETVMPLMSTELFPAVFTGVFLVIVLGAIMSTVDSLLIMASSSVVRDLIQQVLRPAISESRLSFWGRATTLIIGALALPFALQEARILFWFVLFAWSGLAAAFTPAVILCLFWPRTTKAGVLVGMIGGFLTTVVWVIAFKERYYDLYEMIPGFAVGVVLIVLVSLFTQPSDEAVAEFHEVKASLR